MRVGGGHISLPDMCTARGWLPKGHAGKIITSASPLAEDCLQGFPEHLDCVMA
jgi:hypothetical protein